MDRCNDDQVVFLRDVLDKRNDLERGSRVQTGRWLVQEEKFGRCDELSSDTNTTFLTTRYTLTNWCSDQVVGLVLKTKSGDEGMDALNALELADRGWERQTSSEAEGLADGERADERIFLFDVCTDSAKDLWVRRSSIDIDTGSNVGLEGSGAMSEDVEECSLS